MRIKLRHVLTVLLVTILSAYGHAQNVAIFSPQGVALRGYDAVAYFTDNAAIKGSKKFSFEWQGVQWHFQNQAHLDAFKAAPQKYTPQFGGYCAYGVMENHKAPTEPDAFTIVDGKLYLNYNRNVRELWLKDTADYIIKGKDNWTTLKDKKE